MTQLQAVDRQLASGATITRTGQGLIQEKSIFQKQLRTIEHQRGLDAQVEEVQRERVLANSETDLSIVAASIGSVASSLVIPILLTQADELRRRRAEDRRDRRYAEALRQLT